MRLIGPLALSATLMLTGCDVVVAALLATLKKSKSSSAAGTAPAVDVSYSLYVAHFANPAAATAEETNITNSGGIPNPATWTFVGKATATTIWNGLPAGMNAALIQAPLTVDYNIDTFERLDADGAVVEVPTSANVYANATVTNPQNASGVLDGIPATTVNTNPAQIPCIFALFTQTITSLRVRLWGAAQTSGDCVWVGDDFLPAPNVDTFVVGGAAADASGNLYATYADTTLGQSYLLPFTPTGSKGTLTSVSLTASTTGSLSTAVDAEGNVFVAATLSSGKIQLQKFTGGSTPGLAWPVPTTFTGTSNNTLGPAGLAVASNAPLSGGGTGTVIVFAGSEGTTGTHIIVRYDDEGSAGSYVWGPILVTDSSNPTSWSAVATSGITDVLTTGTLTSAGNVDILTEDSTLALGSVNWPNPITTSGSTTLANSANGVGADGFGFAYVVGSLGSSVNGKDSVLLRYKIADGSGLTTLYQNSTFTGANEFTGLAVDTDGTAYVVGYVTLSDLVSTTAIGATTSMWIGRFPPGGGVPLWTATFNAGVGNDHAVSVSLSGNYVYVVGQESLAGPKSGMHVFKFLK